MVCPICNGLTEVRSDRINNCAICVGSGKVKRWVDGFGNQYLFQPPNIWVSEQWVTCQSCNGKAGTILRDVEIICPFCLGKGTIYFINKILKINTELAEVSADFTKPGQKKINRPITIGDKEWMSKNLSTELYANGDSIPQARDSIEWKRFNERSIGCWCFYDFNSVYEEKFYNWYAVNNSRGLAPEGWQVASDAEWIELISIFGGKEKAGKKIKSTVGWDDKLNGSNTSGLNVSPYGSCNSSGSFSGIGHLGDFWTSTQYDINYAFSINVTSVSFIEKTFDFKSAGKSVRCIRDHP